ncbi:hypothetical protein PDENDC454_18338, partial [Paenibacillus dendritiformis C454]
MHAAEIAFFEAKEKVEAGMTAAGRAAEEGLGSESCNCQAVGKPLFFTKGMRLSIFRFKTWLSERFKSIFSTE